MKDRIKDGRRKSKEEAISFVRIFADEKLKNYVEPGRAGISKGDRIGFSINKQRAAYFMTLYPNCLRLNEIADLSGVPSGSLRAWKKQKDFIDLIVQASNSHSEAIINTFELDVMEKYPTIFPEIKKSLYGKSVLDIDLKAIYKNPNEASISMFLADILPFLNSHTAVKVTKWLLGKEPGNPGTLEYSAIAYRIIKSIHVRSEKGLKKWVKIPEILDLTKDEIGSTIDFLIDPETLKQPRDEIECLAKDMKKRIFETFDILVS